MGGYNITSARCRRAATNHMATGRGDRPLRQPGIQLTGTYLIDLITERARARSVYCVGSTPRMQHVLLAHRGAVASPVPDELADRWDLDCLRPGGFYGETEGLTGPQSLHMTAIDRILPSENYFDSRRTGQSRRGLGHARHQQRAGRQPFVSASVGTTGNGNTYPQTYDALGRYVFLRATVGFYKPF